MKRDRKIEPTGIAEKEREAEREFPQARRNKTNSQESAPRADDVDADEDDEEDFDDEDMTVLADEDDEEESRPASREGMTPIQQSSTAARVQRH